MTTHPPTRYQVFQEIEKERSRQILLGYDWLHDDQQGIHHITGDVVRRLWESEERSTLIECAAMLEASVEAFDRREMRFEKLAAEADQDQPA